MENLRWVRYENEQAAFDDQTGEQYLTVFGTVRKSVPGVAGWLELAADGSWGRIAA